VALFYALGEGRLFDAVMAASRLKHSSRTAWWWPSHPFGKLTGDEIQEFARVNLKGRMGDARIPCGVVVANLTKRRQEIVTSWGDPEEPPALAARATSSVPLLFEPVEWPGRGLCVDGGVTSNAAGDDFSFPNRFETVTVVLEGARPSAVNSLSSYASALVETVLNEGAREDTSPNVVRLPQPPGDSLRLDFDRGEAQGLYVRGYTLGRTVTVV
jgi:predicted acylesterase/phospholipase RssA